MLSGEKCRNQRCLQIGSQNAHWEKFTQRMEQRWMSWCTCTKETKVKRKWPGTFQSGPVTKTPSSQCKGAWVQSLIMELRSHIPRGNYTHVSQLEKHLCTVKTWNGQINFLKVHLLKNKKERKKQLGIMSKTKDKKQVHVSRPDCSHINDCYHCI